MKKRLLGTLTVSEVGMGCMGFSHGYGAPPEESYAVEAIRKAFDFGCTLFDTAEAYGREQFYPGHNEKLVGKALAPFRKEAVLATKLHLGSKEERADKSTYQVVKEHLAQSMKRLQTDYIDLYYLHRLSEDVPVEEVAEAMGRLIQEGLIRGWGLSQVSTETLDRAHRVTPVSAVQNLYNMVERDCEGDIFPYCIRHHIGVVPFSPIASGLLSGKITAQTKFEGDDVRKFVPQLSQENLAANQPLVDLLAGFAQAKACTPAQIALAWMLYKYPNVVPIPGSKNQERILENLGGANVLLTPQEFARLEEELNAHTVHGHRGHVEWEGKSFSNNWRQQ